MVEKQIAEELKKYSHYTGSILCLECGYEGRMGIKSFKNTYKIGVLIALVILLVIVFIGHRTLVNFIGIGVGVGMLFSKGKPHIVVCPNCKRELAVNK